MTFATGFAGYPSTNLFLALTFKGRRGRGILYCACISLNFLKLTGWRLYRFRLARLYGTCNFRSSLSPSSWLQVLPAGSTVTLGIPLSLKPCFRRKQVMLCFKHDCNVKSSSGRFICIEKSHLRETSRYGPASALCLLLRPPRSPEPSIYEGRRFPAGVVGFLKAAASPSRPHLPPAPPHPTHLTPTSRPHCPLAAVTAHRSRAPDWKTFPSLSPCSGAGLLTLYSEP